MPSLSMSALMEGRMIGFQIRWEFAHVRALGDAMKLKKKKKSLKIQKVKAKKGDSARKIESLCACVYEREREREKSLTFIGKHSASFVKVNF